ncbi:unnamed protein product, partial [Allacma fusca]
RNVNLNEGLNNLLHFQWFWTITHSIFTARNIYRNWVG